MGILLVVGALLLAGVVAAVLVVERAGGRRAGAAASDVAAAPDGAQVRVDRSDLLRRIGDAFDLAVDDEQVHAAAGRSLAHLQRERRTELLDVDPLTGTLRPVARSADPNGELAVCPVRTAADCPSMRRAQVLVAARSDDVDACGLLRDRPDGVCSAACVPVAVDGHTVGVVHVVGSAGSPPDADELMELNWLAGRSGARRDRPSAAPERAASPEEMAPPTPGALASPLPESAPVSTSDEVGPPDGQADHQSVATPSVVGEPGLDPVSGLPGPGALRARLESLVAQQRAFVLVIADVDGLGGINRDLGHAAGDAVIRALADALASHGGPDSFAADGGDGTIALVCPGLTLQASVELVERVRGDLLDRALRGATTAFTCSFGITHSRAAADAAGVLALALSGARRATSLGGDEIVYANEVLAGGDETVSPTN